MTGEAAHHYLLLNAMKVRFEVEGEREPNQVEEKGKETEDGTERNLDNQVERASVLQKIAMKVVYLARSRLFYTQQK